MGLEVTNSVFRHPRLATTDLTGQTLIGCEAIGKHLFCRFERDLSLHLHLLMQGRVIFGPPTGVDEWRRRFEISFGSGAMTGVDVPLLHLLRTEHEGEFTGHLGPDLCGAFDPAAALARLEAQGPRPIAAALLDQRTVAGFGNIYAVESPFIIGLNPHTPVEQIEGLEGLLTIATALIRTNAKLGPQNTTGRQLRRSDQWVLPSKTRSCRLCGARLRRQPATATPWQRRTAWCPTCQAEPNRTVDLGRARKLLALHPARSMVDFATGQLAVATDARVEPNRGRG